MLKLSTFIFCIMHHFGQKNIVSVVIFSLGNLYRTGWSVFSASEIGFECEFCIKRNACQSFCFSKSLSANCNIMLLNARDKNWILSSSMKNLVFLHRNIPLFISSLFLGHSSSRDGWESTQWIMDTSKFTHIL